MLRISHKYGKSGAQVLFSMGALEHIASCRAINMQIKVLFMCSLASSISFSLRPSAYIMYQGSLRRIDAKFGRDLDVDKRRMIIAPILRLVFSLTSLIDASEFFEISH
ncbi:Nuclear pore complex protein [Actinidia chinensis var. chinensis]|uniref:Nuclear pore complex protein n=1 Tax=Actinidia chinensis var. chinensis TaxID=1590841 RepID=A0A2R6QHT6_ACTCC|nr:Nuclear pore complex protein [Actinidia chinensis var. chinensis]